MKVVLADKVEYEPETIEESWISSEVNDHGDLTVYRKNEYAISPIAHFAVGEWTRVY